MTPFWALQIKYWLSNKEHVVCCGRHCFDKLLVSFFVEIKCFSFDRHDMLLIDYQIRRSIVTA